MRVNGRGAHGGGVDQAIGGRELPQFHLPWRFTTVPAQAIQYGPFLQPVKRGGRKVVDFIVFFFLQK
jgi:hypothetical protein